MTPTRPRDGDGVFDAGLLIAREEGVESAIARIQSELKRVKDRVDDTDPDERWVQEKNALHHGLGKLRKRYDHEVSQ